MSTVELTAYRQQLALCALNRLGKKGGTSGEVAELMGSLAQAEGHPPECWRGLDRQAAAGHLRSLSTRGKCSASERRDNSRAGRSEPVWTLPGPCETKMAPPDPPAHLVARPGRAAGKGAAPAPDEAYRDLSRSQLMAMLRVYDDLSASVSRFLRDMDEVRNRARRELEAAGVLEAGE